MGEPGTDAMKYYDDGLRGESGNEGNEMYNAIESIMSSIMILIFCIPPNPSPDFEYKPYVEEAALVAKMVRGDDLADTITDKQKEILDRLPDIEDFDEANSSKEGEDDGGGDGEELDPMTKARNATDTYHRSKMKEKTDSIDLHVLYEVKTN